MMSYVFIESRAALIIRKWIYKSIGDSVVNTLIPQVRKENSFDILKVSPHITAISNREGKTLLELIMGCALPGSSL